MVADPAELERRLNQGAELTIGEVAVLLGLGRSTVHEMLRDGKIRYTQTPGGHRRAHAKDVQALLAERRRVRRGRG